jgi:hypothetical protein
MNKRTTENFPLSKGLKLWYSYNKQAISKSNDLCRVVASHRSIMSKPQPEFDRIFNELNKCGVQIPHKVRCLYTNFYECNYIIDKVST